MFSQEDFNAHVALNKHRIRWWCEQNHIKLVADVNWYRLWDDVSGAMKLADRPQAIQNTITQAYAQARQEILAGDELFPEGWDTQPFR